MEVTMADPKKPAVDPADKPKEIPPEEMRYPTPEVDPKTGSPIDSRFQSDNRQEAPAQQAPKSETAKAKDDAPEEDEDDDDDDDKKTSKGKEKPRRR
jgi:hypothetical protein